jgi:hypothetical protein
MMATRTLVLTIVVVLAFAAALLWIDGWRVDPVGGEHIPAARNASYTAAECEESCKAAMIALPGVRASMTADELTKIATAKYGADSAEELRQAMNESRLLLLDGKLFFPTRELCRQNKLTGECAAACKRYNLRVP